MSGHKRPAEAVGYDSIGRGASRVRGRCAARRAGARGKANVGMSNDNARAKRAHRKTKVS